MAAIARRRTGKHSPLRDFGSYALFINLRRRRCVVIGGGAVAEGKVTGLLAAGADVTVISPALTEALREAARTGRVAYRARHYRDGDLAGAALAFVATDDRAATAAVAAEGRRRAIWVNAADEPAHCDFILPALVRRGPLAIAVSTGGVSPALASTVRDEIARTIGDEYEALTAVAGAVRRALRAEGRAVDGQRWRAALADRRLRRLVARGEQSAARRHLRARLGVR